MKALFNLTIAFCLVTSLFSCKKGDNDLMETIPTTNASSNVLQSAPAVAGKSNILGVFSIGSLSEYVLLGAQHTEVHTEDNVVVNGGKWGVGPAGRYHNHATANVNVYTHNGVTITEHGTLNGTLNESQNMGGLNGDLNRISDQANALTPTVTIANLNSSTTIVGNGVMNVISIGKLKLDQNDNFVLSGNSTELFIINVGEDFEMSGNAKIIMANGALSSHVLINMIGRDGKVISKSTNVINGTVVSADRTVELGSVNGQILSGDKDLKVVKNSVVNYIPFAG